MKIIINSFLLFTLISCGGSSGGSSRKSPTNGVGSISESTKDNISDMAQNENQNSVPSEQSSINKDTENSQNNTGSENVTEVSMNDNGNTATSTQDHEVVQDQQVQEESSQVTENDSSTEQNEVSDESNANAVAQDVIEQNANENAAIQTEDVFVFNHNNGKCLNSVGDQGRNADQLGNCGNMNAQTIDGVDFTDQDFYGVSLEDTFITNSKVTIANLVEYEALLNSGSQVDGIDNLLEALFEAYANEYTNGAEAISAQQAKIDRLQVKLDELKLEYTESTNEKEQEKIERSIASTQEQIEKATEKANDLMNKRSRQKEFSLYYGDNE